MNLRKIGMEKKYFSPLFFILLYILFLTGEEDTTIGPGELEMYRAELSDWVVENIDNMRRDQSERRDLVREVCSKYGITSKGPQQPREARRLKLKDEEWEFLKRINWQYIYFSQPHSLIWCKVPKAGSSTWTYNFLKLVGQTTNSTKIHKLLRDYFPKQESKKIFKDSFKFMVVRHPFERILSAYRDKLEDISRDLEARDGYYYSMYGRHIVEEFRDRSNSSMENVLEPTWKEFVTYIINTPVTKFDEHWTPIWMLCSPCILRYNVIAKMETFSEDTQFTLEEAGLDNILEVEWKHRTGTGESLDTVMGYYSELTLTEVVQLYRKYRLDFELYGYSPEQYFDVAIQENQIY